MKFAGLSSTSRYTAAASIGLPTVRISGSNCRQSHILFSSVRWPATGAILTTPAIQHRSCAVSWNNTSRRGRKNLSAPMASLSSAGSRDIIELKDESDFHGLVSPDGYISICGFGSLLSERSARSTFPELRDFRVARLQGFRRVFCHTAPVFFERGIAKAETGEISSLSVEPCEGETLVVTVFDIKRSEIPSFIEREHEFRFLAVTPEDLNAKPCDRLAVLCARYTDEEYVRVRCKGNQDIYFQRYGKYNIHKIWRDDIFPCRIYLRHCVLAAKNLGQLAHENFLDHTFIADRKTTIREYLSSTGAGIMEEEPPEALQFRYGG